MEGFLYPPPACSPVIMGVSLPWKCQGIPCVSSWSAASSPQDQGASLTVRHCSAVDAFRDLLGAFEINAVYAYKEVCSQEVKIERRVGQLLATAPRGSGGAPPPRLSLDWGFTLYHKEDLPADVFRRYPRSYTGFRKVTLVCICGSCTTPSIRAPLPHNHVHPASPICTTHCYSQFAVGCALCKWRATVHSADGQQHCTSCLSSSRKAPGRRMA